LNLEHSSPVEPRTLNFEPLTPPHVLITGDVMADALQFAATKATAQSDILTRLGLQPQRYILATVHRAENTDDPQRLSNIMAALAELAEREPVILPLHPRTKKILERTSNLEHRTLNVEPRTLNIEQSSSVEPRTLNIEPRTLNIERPSSLRIINPVGYFDIIALEKSARILLTDSGGMQKEAYWLKVPCITLRDETEWVETVASGWNILTGAERDRIVTAVRTFKAPAAHPPLYGDGQAAEKILSILCQNL
jgi:UDP-N-acetylglucosamine 2-epimerase